MKNETFKIVGTIDGNETVIETVDGFKAANDKLGEIDDSGQGDQFDEILLRHNGRLMIQSEIDSEWIYINA